MKFPGIYLKCHDAYFKFHSKTLKRLMTIALGMTKTSNGYFCQNFLWARLASLESHFFHKSIVAYAKTHDPPMENNSTEDVKLSVFKSRTQIPRAQAHSFTHTHTFISSSLTLSSSIFEFPLAVFFAFRSRETESGSGLLAKKDCVAGWETGMKRNA